MADAAVADEPARLMRQLSLTLPGEAPAPRPLEHAGSFASERMAVDFLRDLTADINAGGGPGARCSRAAAAAGRRARARARRAAHPARSLQLQSSHHLPRARWAAGQR